MRALMMLRVWKEMLTMWGCDAEACLDDAESVEGDADNVRVRC